MDLSARLPRPALVPLTACALLLAAGAAAADNTGFMAGFPGRRGDSSSVSGAAAKINGATMLENIKVLASDDFEGRSPGTPGEDKTIAYLQQQFRKLGLSPGNPDGSYLQAVPMEAGISTPTISFSTGAKSTELHFPDDVVAWDSRREPEMNRVGSELVFVGYGVTAPEYRWDDYKGADLKGKTLLMLINDPPVPDPRHPGLLDPATFGGDAMTYYGRWTYKYEMAAKLGAAGALIIHETKAAAYPFAVVQNSWGRENFALAQPNGAANPDLPPLAGWIQLDRARDIFRSVGMDFDSAKQAALSRDFKPVALGVTLDATSINRWRDVASHNVVAKITGSDPVLKNEVVVYTAHWDHFGIDDKLPGPRSAQIFHGAQDNASGVAMLLEVARAYKAMKTPPKRSILFLLTTGEERGLLGAQYYARHPLYPLQKTVLGINVDMANLWGRTRDIEIIGAGKSTADDLVVAAAKRQQRKARPDSKPEAGRFYRSDQLELAKAGVPVLFLKGGTDYVGKPAGFGKATLDAFTAQDYHKVSDNVRPDWNMAGAVQDAQLIYAVGLAAANGKIPPQWKPGAEFRAARAGAQP